MKKILLGMAMVIGCGVAMAENEMVGFDAVVTEAGTLKEVIGDKLKEIDSLVVKGPVNEVDFRTMWECASSGQTKVFNLEMAEVEGNRIPKDAFVKREPDIPGLVPSLQLHIKRVILPEGIVAIGDYAFLQSGLQEINIPQSLRSLGDMAFMGCDLHMECLEIPEGVKEIPFDCFASNRNIQSVKLPSTIKRLGTGCLYEFQGDEIDFPNGLEYIGKRALAYSNLTKIVLPNSVTELGEDAFAMSMKVKEIVWSENLTEISMGGFYCLGIERLTVPGTVKEVDLEGLAHCLELVELVFEEGVEELGMGACSKNCKLERVELPASMKKLGDRVFNECDVLREVTCKAVVPPVADIYTFSSAVFPSDVTLYVPVGSGELYRNAEGWKEFKNILERDMSGVGAVGVDEVEMEAVYYDLMGRVVERPVKGVFVVKDGKGTRKVIL